MKQLMNQEIDQFLRVLAFIYVDVRAVTLRNEECNNSAKNVAVSYARW